MSNYNNRYRDTIALSSLLLTAPTISHSKQDQFKFGLGISYTQTVTGELDKFAHDEVSIYNASMPGTTEFVRINHHLPLLALSSEYQLIPQLGLNLEISGISSHLIGGLEETRTTPAKTEQFDFGDTNQKWTQFLNIYLQTKLTLRQYTQTGYLPINVFTEIGLSATYLNADSQFSFHVQAENYAEGGVITWKEVLNLLDAYRDMNSTANTKGYTLGPTAAIGLNINILEQLSTEFSLGATYHFGNVDINLKTRYPNANPKNNPSNDRTKSVDNSGLVPHLNFKMRY